MPGSAELDTSESGCLSKKEKAERPYGNPCETQIIIAHTPTPRSPSPHLTSRTSPSANRVPAMSMVCWGTEMKPRTPLPHHACLDPAAGDKSGGDDCITNRTGSSSVWWWCKSLSSWLCQMQIVSMLWVITPTTRPSASSPIEQAKQRPFGFYSRQGKGFQHLGEKGEFAILGLHFWAVIQTYHEDNR